MILVRIEAPHFTAGMTRVNGKTITCAPILSFMKKWKLLEIQSYCNCKNYKLDITKFEK